MYAPARTALTPSVANWEIVKARLSSDSIEQGPAITVNSRPPQPISPIDTAPLAFIVGATTS